MRPDDVDAIVATIDRALAPVRERMTAIETQMDERMKAAAADVDQAKGDLAFMRGAVVTLRERVGAIETRPPTPGPPGRDGEPGPPGPPGAQGSTGPGFRDKGTYQAGTAYEPGDALTDDGSLFICQEPTTTRPGTGSAWRLAVKRGKNGRDAKGAQ